MSNLADALVVIDLQKGVSTIDYPLVNLETILQQVNKTIAIYRTANHPIIFIQHEDDELIYDSQEWTLFDELDAMPSDIFIRKTHANAFYETNLKDQLGQLKIKSIELCGAQTDFCVDATVKFAHGLHYQLMMQQGLSTTSDNLFLTGEKTVAFFESIWDHRYLEIIKNR